MSLERPERSAIKSGNGLPTIPASANHQDGTWIATDIYDSELYKDDITGQVYTRNGASIVFVGAPPSLLTTIIPIGPWDMQTTQQITVAHTVVDYLKIRTVEVIILSDNSSKCYPLSSFSILDVVNGGVNQIDSLDISLISNGNGDFNSIDFSDLNINRGFMTIQHIA